YNNPILSAKILFTISKKSQASKGFSLFDNKFSYVRFSYGLVNTTASKSFSQTNTPSLLFSHILQATLTSISPLDEQNATFSIDVTKEITQLMQIANRPVDMPIVFICKGYGEPQKRIFFYSTQTPDKSPRLIVKYQFIP